MIRPEEPRDIAAIRSTNEEAFGAASEARLVDALRGAPDSISLVATEDDRVIGHILFTPVTIDPPADVRVAGLAPMSVRPAHQRKGVGRELVLAGLEACRQRAYHAVVVVGHPQYYPRFGFVQAQMKHLECEFPVPPDAWMLCELQVNALAGVSGVVRYRPEFRE